MIDINYEGYGYDTCEQFVSTAIQCNTQFDGEKTAKSGITYTNYPFESFVSEDYPKTDDLLIPVCDKERVSGDIIDDDDVNSEKTEN